jgi:hypothetical protein
MDNSVRRYLDYGDGLVQEHVLSEPLVLSCDPVSICFSEEQPFSSTGP